MLPAEATPPCIAAIHRDLAAGKAVGHRGRLAFASFMLQMGVEPADVARQFSRQENYSQQKTEGIVNGLVRDKYLPMSCKNMALHRLCTEQMKEPMCRSIRNPVVYGRIRTGTVGPGPKAPELDAAPTIAKCGCGEVLGPVVGKEMAQALANQHYWSQDVADEAKHIEVLYEKVGPSP